VSDVLGLALFAGAVIACLAWFAVVLVSPRQMPSDSPSQARTILARCWLYAPIWVPLVVLTAALTPGLADAFGLPGDHCLSHQDTHHHLCVTHPPRESGHWMTWAFPLGVWGTMALILGACTRRAWKQWRMARVLIRLSVPSDYGSDVRIVEQSVPLALTLGLFRPSILVSTGLVARTSGKALGIVLAHERAHVARRDTLFAFLDQFPAALLPQRVSRRLLAELTLAREQACDAVAARKVGPGRVAAALAEFASLNMPVPAVGLSVVSGALEARVMHLLHPPTPTWRWALAPIAVLALLVATGLGPGHSAIEHLLTFILH
jgi:hypothetical protein